MWPELLTETEPFIMRWRGDELITPNGRPMQPTTCSEETLLEAKEIADKHNTLIHIYISETREEVDGLNLIKDMSPVGYLDKLGMLNDRLVAVHCVWFSLEGAYLLAERRANVVDCTVSNLELSAGPSPLNYFLEAEVNVGLGTDGLSVIIT
jgi:5-methylthioadenosine/S-adenosylhomocysteine deaminase